MKFKISFRKNYFSVAFNERRFYFFIANILYGCQLQCPAFVSPHSTGLLRDSFSIESLTMILHTLGHYTIKRKIGEGGMGEVYEGEDRRLLRRVAIKIVPSPQDRSESERQRLMQEARLASAINHPNICTVYDVGKVNGSYYIVMEFIEGETLQQLLQRRGRLTEQETADIGTQICSALAAAHEKGIVHRDIKPENIMMTRDGRVKIMDFGLARLLNETTAPRKRHSRFELPGNASKTSASGIEGTVLYMAPEQIDRGCIDQRTDVYALGAVLYEMLTGEPPFRGPDSLSLITAILESPPPSPDAACPGISDEMGRVVQKALAKEPAARFANVRELQAALDEVGAPAVVKRPRRPWAVSVVTAVLILLLFGALRLHRSDKKTVLLENLRELRSADYPAAIPRLSADGRHIAYLVDRAADASSMEVVVEDLQSGRIRRISLSGAEVEIRPGPWDWSADMRRLLLSGRHGGFVIVDTTGSRARRVSDFGFGGRWSPDGRFIAFSRFDPTKLIQTNEIWLLDLRKNVARSVSPQDGRAYYSPSWAPDGRRLVCIGGVGSDRSLWLIDLESGEHRMLMGNEMAPQMPEWSGSGKYVYFVGADAELWRLAVESDEGTGPATPERVLPNQSVREFRLSRDGRTLIFSQRSLAEDLWLFRLPLGPGSPWSDAERMMRPRNWGITNIEAVPGSDRLILEASVTSRRALLLLDLNRKVYQVVYDSMDAFAPSMSPDGRWVVFDAGGGDQADIWRAAVTTGFAEKLFEYPGADWMPRFSPDGKQISFVSNRTGNFDIWLFNLQDSAFRRITDTPEMESGGYWSGDGRKLAFFVSRRRRTTLRCGFMISPRGGNSAYSICPAGLSILPRPLRGGPAIAIYFFQTAAGWR